MSSDANKPAIDYAVLQKALPRDIELAIFTDSVNAGSVYVDLEGYSPRILADIHDPQRFQAFAKRFFDIIETLHTTFREGGDGTPRPRGLTFSVDGSKVSNHLRIEAHKELETRLASAGCDVEAIQKLIAPSA